MPRHRGVAAKAGCFHSVLKPASSRRYAKRRKLQPGVLVAPSRNGTLVERSECGGCLGAVLGTAVDSLSFA